MLSECIFLVDLFFLNLGFNVNLQDCVDTITKMFYLGHIDLVEFKVYLPDEKKKKNLLKKHESI